MTNLKEFLLTYWQHARNITDVILLVTGVISLFFRKEIEFAGWLSYLLFVSLLILASYRTWYYEHAQVSRLKRKRNDKMTFDKLTTMQRDILTTLDGTPEKAVAIFNVAGTSEPVFHGLQSISGKYNFHEFRAQIEDLATKRILKVEHVGVHDSPVYKPTKLFFDLLNSRKAS